MVNNTNSVFYQEIGRDANSRDNVMSLVLDMLNLRYPMTFV